MSTGLRINETHDTIDRCEIHVFCSIELLERAVCDSRLEQKTCLTACLTEHFTVFVGLHIFVILLRIVTVTHPRLRCEPFSYRLNLLVESNLCQSFIDCYITIFVYIDWIDFQCFCCLFCCCHFLFFLLDS